jgi:hypothetical protein
VQLSRDDEKMIEQATRQAARERRRIATPFIEDGRSMKY